MATTPLQALPVPSLSDAPNGPAQFLTFGTAVEKQLWMTFTTAVARDAAITVPVKGMVAVLTTPERVTMYNGTAWVVIGWFTAAGRPGVQLSDAAQSIPNATATDITWGTEVADPDGWTSGGSATITVPVGQDGVYAVTFAPGFAVAALGAAPYATVKINSSAIYGTAGLSGVGAYTVSFVRPFAAGDTIIGTVFQNSGGAVNCSSLMQIVWLGR